MSVTPEHFLKFAERALNATDANEFDFRNAAGRAYYAAYHCCLAEKSRGQLMPGADIKGTHDKLYRLFESLDTTQSPENAKLKSMAYMAKMMKSVRHEADYQIKDDFDRREAAQQVADAKKVLASWKSIQP